MTIYVLGFVFDKRDRVLLYRKPKGSMHAGKWNGIGGKVEGKETPYVAMRREYVEEAPGLPEPRSWSDVCTLYFEETGNTVHVWRGSGFRGDVYLPAGSNLQWLGLDALLYDRTLAPHTSWLIAMAKADSPDSSPRIEFP